jgi:hypothetical protein
LITYGRFAAGYPWVLIRPDATASGIEFRSNAGDAQLVITQATGNVAVSAGNLVIGTSGKGIDFSATSGTGTSELLNDYEEGDWTPTQGAGLTVVGTFSSSGTYTKIGRQVTVTATLSATTIACAAGAEITAGLPFTPARVVAGASVNTGFTSTITYVTTTSSIFAMSATPAAGSVFVSATYFV